MEGLKNVTYLALAQTVEVSHNRIEFVDHVLFLVIFQTATFDTHGACPLAVTTIASRQSSGQAHDPSPYGIGSVWSGDRKRSQNVEVRVNLNKAPCVPVQRNRRQHTQKKGLIFFIPARPQKVRAGVGDEDFRRQKCSPYGASVCGSADITKSYAGPK